MPRNKSRLETWYGREHEGNVDEDTIAFVLGHLLGMTDNIASSMAIDNRGVGMNDYVNWTSNVASLASRTNQACSDQDGQELHALQRLIHTQLTPTKPPQLPMPTPVPVQVPVHMPTPVPVQTHVPVAQKQVAWWHRPRHSCQQNYRVVPDTPFLHASSLYMPTYINKRDQMQMVQPVRAIKEPEKDPRSKLMVNWQYAMMLHQGQHEKNAGKGKGRSVKGYRAPKPQQSRDITCLTAPSYGSSKGWVVTRPTEPKKQHFIDKDLCYNTIRNVPLQHERPKHATSNLDINQVIVCIYGAVQKLQGMCEMHESQLRQLSGTRLQ